VLVTAITDPSWTPALALASALVTDMGSILSHGAILAREFGVPSVVGTRTGTLVIPDGARVTVDGGAGTVLIHPAGQGSCPPA
jgi:phosphohistidine swiveling domain-containing protein